MIGTPKEIKKTVIFLKIELNEKGTYILMREKNDDIKEL